MTKQKWLELYERCRDALQFAMDTDAGREHVHGGTAQMLVALCRDARYIADQPWVPDGKPDDNYVFNVPINPLHPDDCAVTVAMPASQAIGHYATQVRAMQETIADREQAKDAAYRERNKLLAFLSRLYPAHLCRHPDSDTHWAADWRHVACIHLPTGQTTWHIHDSELPLFAHLKMGEAHSDGHTTEEKYRRLEALGVQTEHIWESAQ